MSRVVCECGTELLKTSLKAHLLTEKHKRLLAAMPKRAPAKLSEAQAKEILTSAMKSRTARQELSFLQQKKEANKQIKKIGKKDDILQIENYTISRLDNLLDDYSYISDDKMDKLMIELGNHLTGDIEIDEDHITYLIELINSEFDEEFITEEMEDDTKAQIFEALRDYISIIELGISEKYDLEKLLLNDIKLTDETSEGMMLEIFGIDDIKKPYFSYILIDTITDEKEKINVMCFEKFKYEYLKNGNFIRKKLINMIFESLIE